MRPIIECLSASSAIYVDFWHATSASVLICSKSFTPIASACRKHVQSISASISRSPR
ncbi:hypothetical protein GJA_4754 [Janthinobacterium agaricidamnosum NBRC 102515 = DSM 9628]|uniref:Uncharacterized protein n=1 Tax=Janthinobacterium agaricidamnosum NBRC 102515 = DSM 9628 TaxID=1349767 RepID=W0VDH2_9BURK|nr:hypothetical protein GJA_4754 [Janthinobacterium agaricidamnosum NBRC 102515 = DSM 9628]